MGFRNIIISLTVVIFTFSNCNPKGGSETDTADTGKQIEIIGTIEGGAATEITLEEMAAREFIPLDTVTCDDKGKFRIIFEPEETAFYVLRTGPSGYITLLAEPGESMRISIASGRNDQYNVEGSEGSELLMVLSREHKRALDALGQITRRNLELQTSPDYARMKEELDFRFDSITGAFRNYSLEFIHNNHESLAILVALYNLYGQGLPVFHPEQDLQVYAFVDSVLMISYPGFEVVELLHAQVAGAMVSKGEGGQVHGPDMGEIAPDFVSSRPDGEQMALSDLSGNLVLLHFWAAWSKPSREENRYLVEAWEKYGTSSFRIMQVSFDNDRDFWLRAIEEDGLRWDQVSDLKRWETMVADLYQVEKIPANFLIGPDGKILGKDLFGNALIEQLEALYNNE